jgi:nicotinamidase-related amidase
MRRGGIALPKKCLVVVDYQNDFVCGSLGFPGAAAIEQAIVQKIERYRERGDEVIFTLDTHGEDYAGTQEGRFLPVPHCLDGTEGHALYGRVQSCAKPGDKRLRKDCFGCAALYEYLKTQEFESIELCGLVSNICVLSNAVLCKTAQPQTPVLVDANATAGADESLHNAALDVLGGLQVVVTR